MSAGFQRETRYAVFKLKDVAAYLDDDDCDALQLIGKKIAEGRAEHGKPPFNAVVVEQDWPEFDRVWQMIEARMTGGHTVLLLPPIAERFREIEAERDRLAAENKELVEWQKNAFLAHPNLDLDIEAILAKHSKGGE